jgi:hypothetical protein
VSAGVWPRLSRKQCELPFISDHPFRCYCSDRCREAVRRWSQQQANRRYRASELGKRVVEPNLAGIGSEFESAAGSMSPPARLARAIRSRARVKTSPEDTDSAPVESAVWWSLGLHRKCVGDGRLGSRADSLRCGPGKEEESTRRVDFNYNDAGGSGPRSSDKNPEKSRPHRDGEVCRTCATLSGP